MHSRRCTHIMPFVSFTIEVLDPQNLLSAGLPAQLAILSDWPDCEEPDCWRATGQDGTGRCGDAGPSNGIFHAQLGCAWKDGADADYPFNQSRSFVEHGNLVEPGLYRYRMALSGEGDGFSGSGVDLYAKAGRAIDWFLVDDASDALFEYRLEVGVAADGYSAASIELLRHSHQLVLPPLPPALPPSPPSLPAPPAPPVPPSPPPPSLPLALQLSLTTSPGASNASSEPPSAAQLETSLQALASAVSEEGQLEESVALGVIDAVAAALGGNEGDADGGFEGGGGGEGGGGEESAAAAAASVAAAAASVVEEVVSSVEVLGEKTAGAAISLVSDVATVAAAAAAAAGADGGGEQQQQQAAEAAGGALSAAVDGIGTKLVAGLMEAAAAETTANASSWSASSSSVVVLQSAAINMTVELRRDAAALADAPVSCAVAAGEPFAATLPADLLAFAAGADADAPVGVVATAGVNLRGLGGVSDSNRTSNNNATAVVAVGPLVSLSLVQNGRALPVRDAATPIRLRLPTENADAAVASSGAAVCVGAASSNASAAAIGERLARWSDDAAADGAAPPTAAELASAGCGLRRECRFWDTRTGSWSADGCATLAAEGGSVVCECDHLTEFIVVEFPSSWDELAASLLAGVQVLPPLPSAKAASAPLVC